MPRCRAVAAAAGAGVASVYRQFPSKHELIAALVIRRLDQIAGEAATRYASEGDRWSALVAMLRKIVERSAYDDFMGEARAAVADHPGVRRRDQRDDAGAGAAARRCPRRGPSARRRLHLDLRLLFAATRAAKQVEPAAWRRTLELFIDALEA